MLVLFYLLGIGKVINLFFCNVLVDDSFFLFNCVWSLKKNILYLVGFFDLVFIIVLILVFLFFIVLIFCLLFFFMNKSYWFFVFLGLLFVIFLSIVFILVFVEVLRDW